MAQFKLVGGWKGKSAEDRVESESAGREAAGLAETELVLK